MKHRTKTLYAQYDQRCRGSVYVLVLGVSTIVTVIGLSAIMVTRIHRRTFEGTHGVSVASDYVNSAIELAVVKINQDPNWRQTYTHDTWVADQAIDRGTFKWKLVDTVDTDLNNDISNTAQLVAWGMIGQITQKASVLLTPAPGPPLDLLTTATYAIGDINASATVTGIGGPLVTEGTYNNGNTTNGDVEAATVINAAGVTGTVTTPPPPRTMVGPTVFDLYRLQATQIPFSNIPGGTITLAVLSAASNPYGAINADGIYHINVPPAAILIISKSRIVASLVVTLGAGATFKTQNQWTWEPPIGGSPIMMIDATAGGVIDLNGSTQLLSEASNAVNFNPPGTPYNTLSDTDIVDSYPTLARGLIHLLPGATMPTAGNSFDLIGTLISEGNLSIGSNTQVTVDPNLSSNPPEGYTEPAAQMLIAAGSWRKEVQ